MPVGWEARPPLPSGAVAILTLAFFFFQAEDGIRDTSVTGVQTCALPIWGFLVAHSVGSSASPRGGECNGAPPRSEERRVGKESSARGGLRTLNRRVNAERGSGGRCTDLE